MRRTCSRVASCSLLLPGVGRRQVVTVNIERQVASVKHSFHHPCYLDSRRQVASVSPALRTPGSDRACPPPQRQVAPVKVEKSSAPPAGTPRGPRRRRGGEREREGAGEGRGGEGKREKGGRERREGGGKGKGCASPVPPYPHPRYLPFAAPRRPRAPGTVLPTGPCARLRPPGQAGRGHAGLPPHLPGVPLRGLTPGAGPPSAVPPSGGGGRWGEFT